MCAPLLLMNWVRLPSVASEFRFLKLVGEKVAGFPENWVLTRNILKPVIPKARAPAIWPPGRFLFLNWVRLPSVASEFSQVGWEKVAGFCKIWFLVMAQIVLVEDDDDNDDVVNKAEVTYLKLSRIFERQHCEAGLGAYGLGTLL
ncbi:hypothetical protein CEXT_606681 [Caerostris extrusa]|uniref:Uncharacterized protein n=1 Tax=Caerostris extrusa TaxID=172846 RepID=A0AAV4NRN8_CAEEX|nr:hypothetical protein CEXT_606681 [Caerostris extrusa]